MDDKNKLQLINILLIACICVLINVCTQGSDTVTQTQTVNVGATEVKEKIDINKASIQALETLVGIGEKKAIAIVENRPYTSIWDLTKINGISEDTVRKLESEVTCK